MAKENVVSRAIAKKQPARKSDVWVEGRWIYYAPTFFPAHEPKEWGGRWENKKQAFRLPRLTEIARKIHLYDPMAKMTPDAARYLISEKEWEERDVHVFGSVEQQVGVPQSYGTLYPFQRFAASALVTRPLHGTLLALSPGLGKTPTAIVAADTILRHDAVSSRILVVCPLSLTMNWYREITGTQNPPAKQIQWSEDPRVEICHMTDPSPDTSVRWTITNYEQIMERAKPDGGSRVLATGNLKEAYDFDWDVVIFDESVLIKNRKAKRTMAARTLARNARKVWELSGAPVTRDNSDIWQQFQILEPDYFTSFWRFAHEYCVVEQTPWSMGTIVGSRMDKNLRDDFPELMFVRNQEEVLPDLPEYIWKDIEITLTKKQSKAHADVLENWIHELEKKPDNRVEVTAVIAMLIRLQQITSNLYNLETTGVPWPDESAKADYVEEFLDLGDLDWPVLIWTHHRPGAKALFDRLSKLAKKKDSALYKRRVELVYGGTKGSDRIIEDYKAGRVDVLLLGIQVGKYGHTLVNTRTVITYDKTWDSDAWFQMLHRVRRNGLRHRPVVINPRCRGTVDDFVELNLAGKLPAMAALTGADLAKILRSLGEEYAV